MSELSFLIDLLLNGRLQKSVREKVQARISEVEQNMSLPQAIRMHQKVQASLEPPLAMVTQEAQKAMADRQAAINAAVNQKPQEVTSPGGGKGPRKF